MGDGFYNPGATVSMASDEVTTGGATRHYQKVKVVYGSDDTVIDSGAVKFAIANIGASTTDGALVAAVAAKRILVLAYVVMAGGTATNVTFTTKPAGSGVAISPLLAAGANGGVAESVFPVGVFKTVAGEGLSVTTGAGSTVGVRVTYLEID